MEDKYYMASEIWKKAKFPVAFTGAGISVPSGIPDFRSPGGLWTKYDPMKVATAEAIYNNPKEVWEFLLETLDLLEKSQPNPAHIALAELENNDKLKGIITQNIDNLHQRAGSKNVVEYHGNFERFYCAKCGKKYNKDEVKKIIATQIPPNCKCNGLIRPDVVFFGEPIPHRAIIDSDNLIKNCDLIVICGTSGEVSPANTIPRIVKRNGGSVIEINLGHTHYYDITDIRFNESIDIVLPKLKELILS
ncbi:NAD-dependent protein deacetylase [Desulfothermus naphthae]